MRPRAAPRRPLGWRPHRDLIRVRSNVQYDGRRARPTLIKNMKSSA
jgi:hypothetical protein